MTPGAVEAERAIFCEGYSDRAFWKGWLLRLGCTDPSHGGSIRVRDTRGDIVGRGQYAFHSRSGQFVRVAPCGGKTEVLRQARIHWEHRTVRPLSELVLCLDADVEGEVAAERARQAESIRGWDRDRASGSGDVLLMDDVPIRILLWAAPDPLSSEIGRVQMLDRLVAAALGGAHADRSACVGP